MNTRKRSIDHERRIILHAPPYIRQTAGDTVFLIVPSIPHWIATDERGAEIMSWVDDARQVDPDRYCREMSADR